MWDAHYEPLYRMIEELDREVGATMTDTAPGTEPSTWDEVDLAKVAAGEGEPGPTMMVRADGVALLYPAKIHAFNGEPESGKTWAALIACVEQVRAGNHVVYVDFEDDATTILERLSALGLADEDVYARFHYIRPDEPLTVLLEAKLDALLAKFGPALAVFDGVTEAMTLHNFELKDNTDIARFMRILPRRAARAGAAAVIIDHVVKDEDQRGRYAIGGQHKLAGVDVAYVFEPRQPFGRGLSGSARITVKKDRPGHIRAEATGAKRDHVAELRMTSDDDGAVTTFEVAAPEEVSIGVAGWRPTHLMERISRYLEWQAAPLSRNDILNGVTGNTAAKRQAIAALVAETYVAVEMLGQTLLHRSVKPYRETPEEGADE